MSDCVINEETGYLVQPGDIPNLSKAMIELLGDPGKCRAFGENGRHLVIERYNWEIVTSEMARNIRATLSNAVP